MDEKEKLNSNRDLQGVKDVSDGCRGTAIWERGECSTKPRAREMHDAEKYDAKFRSRDCLGRHGGGVREEERRSPLERPDEKLKKPEILSSNDETTKRRERRQRQSEREMSRRQRER